MNCKLPRVLSILFILFVSMFAFDVFEQPMWFWALLGHLIPSFILTLITILAWRNRKLGGILFIVFALILAIITRNFIAWPILLPPLLIGILFLMHDKN